MLEKDIEKQVLNWLHYNDIFAFKYPTTGRYDPRKRTWIKTRGTITGVSDIIALLHGGTALFIEIKKEGGRQTKNQKDFEKIVTERGFVYVVVKSVEELIKKVGHLL